MTSEVEICHSKRREMDQIKDSVQWLRKKDATSHICLTSVTRAKLKEKMAFPA